MPCSEDRGVALTMSAHAFGILCGRRISVHRKLHTQGVNVITHTLIAIKIMVVSMEYTLPSTQYSVLGGVLGAAVSDPHRSCKYEYQLEGGR